MAGVGQEVEVTINGKQVARKEVQESGIVQIDTAYKPGMIEVANYTQGRKVESSFLKAAGETDALCLTKA